MGFVGVDVVLVAVVGLAVLLGPAGVHVLSSGLVPGPVFGGLALLDLGILFPAATLPGASTKVASIICPARAT